MFVPKRQERRKEGMPLRHVWKFEDDPDVEAVGINDVATRKGQTYATAVYDLKDHHMIALLDGRDGTT